MPAPDPDTVRCLALAGDPAAARRLWRRLAAAAPTVDPALTVLGAELCWAFGRSGAARAHLEPLPTTADGPLVLTELFPQGTDLARRHGGEDWLREVYLQLRSHQQIRAAEQLRHQVGKNCPPLEPCVVRTLHHVACSGGTLISRCLAALPDVVVLSELNPTNRYGPAFNPSHPLALYALQADPLPPEVVQAEFIGQIAQVLDLCGARGSDLVIREHSHSDFFLGAAVAPIQPVRHWLAPRHPLLSAVTLRHPLDSWLGLKAAGWHDQLEPATLRSYCTRYQAFLEAYDDLDWFHYEDFCRDPERVFAEICDVLGLPCDTSALERFASVKLSGDSGRSSDRIELRPRRPLPDDVRSELADPTTARELRQLCRRMGYE